MTAFQLIIIILVADVVVIFAMKLLSDDVEKGFGLAVAFLMAAVFAIFSGYGYTKGWLH